PGVRALSFIVLEVHHGLDEIRVRQTRYTGVLRPAFAVGIMAKAACRDHLIPLAVGDDVGHLTVIPREPVRRTILIANLIQRKGGLAARQLMHGRVGRGWSRRRCRWCWSGCPGSRGRRKAKSPWRRH